MHLRTISASGFKVYDKCPSRYEAEYVLAKRGAMPSSRPAMIGTAVHKALEDYVQDVYLDKGRSPELQYLCDLLEVAWSAEPALGPADDSDPDYQSALDMLATWFNRTDLSEVEVLSVERKSTIEVPTSDGPRSFNYIWDRCDRYVDEDGVTVIRVVDYKTVWMNRGIGEILDDLQVRMYGVAAAVQFKNEEPGRIEIQMDLLRHGNNTVTFDLEELRQFYRDMVGTAEAILADENPVERLNPECHFCIKKATCETLRSTALAGSVAAIADDPEKLMEAKDILSAQKKAIEAAVKEVDVELRNTLDAEQVKALSGSKYKASATVRKTRKMDPYKVSQVIGAAKFSKVATVTVTALDKLRKDGSLTEEQEQGLDKITEYESGASTIRVSKK